MRTAVITDTNSGMSVSEGKQRGIFVIPMPVILDGFTYLEGVNITHRNVFEAMAEGRDLTTSQPSAGDVMRIWDEALQNHDEAVYIPMSSALSGACGTGKMLAEKYNGRVFVADNRRISVPLYEAVRDAKKAADSGCGGAEIAQMLEEHADESSVYITVRSTEYLKKSGRITPAGVQLASLLHILPILKIRGGSLDAYERVRGTRMALKHMADSVRRDLKEMSAANPGSAAVIAAAGTLRDDTEIRRAVRYLEDVFPQHRVIYMPLSCSIACHTGPDAFGAACILIRH